MSAEWNILVFLNAKNNLEQFAFPNFEQMASLGSTEKVNILVEFGRPQNRPYNTNTTDYGGWSKTLRFHIQKGMTPLENQALEDLGPVNMGSAQTLRDFVAWAAEKFPAKRTMLVIWNHGQGWRAPPTTTDGSPPPATTSSQGAVRYVSNDDDTGDKLYNRAIQDMLLELLAGNQIDLVAFDACLMAMVETAYALRDVAAVLVASEELEPGTGWNYERWLKPLIDARGDLDAAALGRLMVKGFADEYGDTDQTTQSAVDLAKVPALAASISAFAEAAIPLLNHAHAPHFRKARAACGVYGASYGMHSVDLGRYMEQIEASELPAGLRGLATEVRAQIKEAVLANYASASRQAKFGSHGLAIYFPESGAAHRRDPDGEGYDLTNQNFPVEFVQTQKWAPFLHEYWKLVP